jgi:hypothetical protein
MIAVDISKMNTLKVVRDSELILGKIKEADEKLNLVKEESFFESIPENIRL